MSILFVTGNGGKFKDAELVFGKDVERVNFDLEEIQSMNPEEVIRHKLDEISRNDFFSNGSKFIMIEDTSLFIDCLGGLPGPFIKYFVERLRPEGISNQVSFNQSSSNQSRAAQAVSCVGVMDIHSGEHFFYKDCVNGSIVSPRGTGGFGWDAIFEPYGSNETYAEMDSETRSMFNMRIKAMKQFLETLK